jgi:hypothetical protein
MPSSALLRVSFQHGMVWNHKKSSSEIVRIGPSGRSRFARPRALSMPSMQKPSIRKVGLSDARVERGIEQTDGVRNEVMDQSSCHNELACQIIQLWNSKLLPNTLLESSMSNLSRNQ